MLVIVIAGLSSSQLFRQQSIFLTLLKSRGLDYRSDPVAQSLRRVGVASILDRAFVRAERTLSRAEAQQLLKKEPRWVVVQEERKPVALMMSADLLRVLSSEQQEQIDLLKIPANRIDSVQVTMRATLQQALELMDDKQVDAVYVGQTDSSGSTVVHGMITRQSIESFYRYR
jgi:hypothetical protein